VNYRRNADVDLRELERRAAGGDDEALGAVVRERLRTGQATLEWLAAAGPLAARHLPEELRRSISETVLASVVVEPPRTLGDWPIRGWFPRHKRHDVCPRGHEIGPAMPFSLEIVGGEREFVTSFDTDGRRLSLHDDWDSETTGMGAQVVHCGGCQASWPYP
jgi:hypothetical protein